MKLTANTIAKLTTNKPDHIEWDDDLPSFGVRLRNGRKTYVIQYRLGAQQRRESLGDVRKVRLDDARRIARQRFASVELGVDPKVQTNGAGNSPTLARAADLYLAARKDVVRPATYSAAVLYFGVQWAPLRGRPIAGITRAEIAARLQEIITAHGRVSAARARAYLSALYGWCVREGLVDSNPVAGSNNPAAGLQARDRVLSPDEIRIIWNACADDDPGRIVKLLLLTACRRDEISRLRWEEVDFDRGVITIAASRCKNHRAHTVTLSEPALELLRAVAHRPGTDFVFSGERGFSGWSHATQALRARVTKPVEFVLHDLRRTAATGMADLGVAPHVIEAVLNHSNGTKVAAIYNRGAYAAEKAAALAVWADRVQAIVENRDARVVRLRNA
jgi:integrase